MALLLFCITSINAPTIPEVGAGVGGVDSWPSDTLEKKVSKIRKKSFAKNVVPRKSGFLRISSYFKRKTKQAKKNTKQAQNRIN